jgi:hypothetical protein
LIVGSTNEDARTRQVMTLTGTWLVVISSHLVQRIFLRAQDFRGVPDLAQLIPVVDRRDTSDHHTIHGVWIVFKERRIAVLRFPKVFTFCLVNNQIHKGVLLWAPHLALAARARDFTVRAQDTWQGLHVQVGGLEGRPPDNIMPPDAYQRGP